MSLPDGFLGGAGLTGRQPVVRVPDPETPESPLEPRVWRAGQVLPANCTRVFQSPRVASCNEQAAGGFGQCAGLQEDGSCLLDLVRRAQEQGVDWSFDVYSDEWGNQAWRYAGPPLDEPSS